MIIAVFASAPIIYLLGRSMGKQVSWATFAVLLVVTVVFAGLLPSAEHESIQEVYNWIAAPLNLHFGLLADGLSVPMTFAYIFVSTAAILFSIPYMQRRLQQEDLEENNSQYAKFYTFFLLYVGSVAGCMLSTNLIQFFLFFEVALVFSWLLVLLYGYGDRKRNSLLYFLWTHIGGGVLLVGILGVYWLTGSFEIADMVHIADIPGAYWVGLAITLGLFVKIGALGFHGWMPDTYSASMAGCLTHTVSPPHQ
jgi:NADH-quinone oxidoreductase subunit M